MSVPNFIAIRTNCQDISLKTKTVRAPWWLWLCNCNFPGSSLPGVLCCISFPISSHLLSVSPVYSRIKVKSNVKNLQYLGFILWEPWMSGPNFMAIHPVVPEKYLSLDQSGEPIDQPTYNDVPRATKLARLKTLICFIKTVWMWFNPTWLKVIWQYKQITPQLSDCCTDVCDLPFFPFSLKLHFKPVRRAQRKIAKTEISHETTTTFPTWQKLLGSWPLTYNKKLTEKIGFQGL